MGGIEDFLVCKIKRNLTKINLNIYQPYIITKMTQGFNKDVKSLMAFNKTSTKHNGVVRNQETDTKIAYDKQNVYISGVGSLLYLKKYSRPEIYITQCKYSKFMDKTNMSHYKDLLHVIKYVIDTKYYLY